MKKPIVLLMILLSMGFSSVTQAEDYPDPNPDEIIIQSGQIICKN
jgi:hypothetical protein